MQTMGKFGSFFMVISLLSLIIGCSDTGSKNKINNPDKISKLLAVSSPDLSNFEPKARENLEDQRTKLDRLVLDKDTPKSTLGLAYGQMGTQYLAHRFFEPARECLRNAAFLNPDAYRWHYFLGRLHLENNQTDNATAAFNRVLSMSPQHAASQVLLAQIAASGGDDTTAETLFAQVLKANPQNAAAHYGMGNVSLRREEYENAARHLQTCLLLQPFARAAHGQLAKALHGMDQPKAAAIQERAATDRLPLLSDPLMDEVLDQRFLLLYRVGEALRLNERDSEAADMYDLAVNIRPDLSGPRLGRVLSLIRAGAHQRAVTSLQDDILAGRETDNFKHMLARLYAASPKNGVRSPEKALQFLEELRQGKMSPGLVETIAMALSNLGKYESAIQYQQTAIEMAIQAEQAELLPNLQKNLALYQEKKACQTPWPANDPLFKFVTYQGENQLQKRPGA